MQKEKVVLMYSGGLDTSVIIPWLKENYDYDVIAVAVDVGQGEELSPLKEKAIKSGASKIYIEDCREEFVTDFIFPTLKAGAVYENKYLLGTSFARPLIAKRMVEIARREGAVAICHGCTGKGNDQVRFELTIKAFAPEMKVIAPWRIWDIKSREQEIEYAVAHGVEVVAKENSYSRDRNIWHISHEGLDLEDPWNEPQDNLYVICAAPSNAPDEAQYVEIEFEKGIPVAVDGERLSPTELLTRLNEHGAKHGVGIITMVENRLVGMKSRGVYETPGGTILYAAHRELESLTLDRSTSHMKDTLAIRYAELVYDGCWYTPLREALDAFVGETQKTCTGKVRVKLYKGGATAVAAQSPYSLHSEEFATFGEDSVYNQADSAGFINLFGLPVTVRALMEQKNNANMGER